MSEREKIKLNVSNGSEIELAFNKETKEIDVEVTTYYGNFLTFTLTREEFLNLYGWLGHIFIKNF